MSAVIAYRLGQSVHTPNGVGTFEGMLFDNGDGHVVVVRHKLDASKPMNAGKCLTPGAKTISGLWAYKPGDVTMRFNKLNG